MKVMLKVLNESEHTDSDCCKIIGLHCDMLIDNKQYLFSIYEDFANTKFWSKNYKDSGSVFSMYSKSYFKSLFFPNLNEYSTEKVRDVMTSNDSIYTDLWILNKKHITFEVNNG